MPKPMRVAKRAPNPIAKSMRRLWRLFLPVGAVLMHAPALAQDACVLNCTARESAWCTGTEWFCSFNARDCIKQCEGQEAPHPIIPPIPPCMTKQNAMRPCSPELVGVDPDLVGTWEATVTNPSGQSRWVWQIREDGTYKFHAEGPGAVPAHGGTFAASKGDWTLDSTTINYSDTGTYQLVAKDTLSAKSNRLGAGTWHRVRSKAAASNGSSK